jgi:hypothetical protein
MVAVSNGASFTFATPIDAFGAYFTGWQVLGQSLTLDYMGGGSTVLSMGTASLSGGTRFFGFIDSGASITGITYTALGDFVGIDDLRYRATIPEPATPFLVASGLVLLGARQRRTPRRRRGSAR